MLARMHLWSNVEVILIALVQGCSHHLCKLAMFLERISMAASFDSQVLVT